MPVTPRVFDNPDELGAAAGRLIADRVAAAQGRRFLLGCPGGRSPSTTYHALAREFAERGLDASQLVIVMMDDYLVPGPTGLERVSVEEPHSCARFGRREIVDVVGRALPAERRIPVDSLWLPDPRDPEAYDRRIRDAGGIDLFVLACGASDGHIAFNPPGSAIDSTTRIVALPDTTRADNLATFPSFGDELSAVPQYGITVGVGTIRAHSREVVMVVHGPDKRLAVERLATTTVYEQDWPATVFAQCRDPHLFVDRAALGAA